MGKLLLVMDETERGKIAFEKLLRLAELGLRTEVYLLFVKEIEIPPIVSEEKELSAYHRMMSETLRKLESYKEKLESMGLKVSDVKVTFGKLADRILLLEKEIKPEMIVIGMKKSPISRLFGRDPCEVLLKKSKSTIIVCRD
jgi:nucleotide-binding universal stress UspA family protein